MRAGRGDREEGGSIVGGSIVLEPSGRAERSVSANLYRLVKRRISQNSRQTSAILGAASPLDVVLGNEKTAETGFRRVSSFKYETTSWPSVDIVVSNRPCAKLPAFLGENATVQNDC